MRQYVEGEHHGLVRGQRHDKSIAELEFLAVKPRFRVQALCRKIGRRGGQPEVRIQFQAVRLGGDPRIPQGHQTPPAGNVRVTVRFAGHGPLIGKTGHRSLAP